MLRGPPAGGAVRRPGARRQPGQGRLALPRPPRRVAGALGGGAERRGAGHQGRRGPLPGRGRLPARRSRPRSRRPRSPGYDPQRAAVEPPGPADVIIVGMGAVGGFVSALLADAGLRVVGFEAGDWRHRDDYHPDELGAAYYCRGDMGPKFLAEAPRWRRNEGEPTRPITFSLGRMMNGVGGSIVHWGGALRRMHPHHFAFRSHIAERTGARTCCPSAARSRTGRCTTPTSSPTTNWPSASPGWPATGTPTRSCRAPPTTRCRRCARPARASCSAAAARELGLHPYPTPVCVNSVPYNGLPATRYHPWSAAFGSFHDDRWNPGLTSVPQALASGRLDLRTHCRVLRLLTDRDGACRRGGVPGPARRGAYIPGPHRHRRRLHVRDGSVADALGRRRLRTGSAGPPDSSGRHFMFKQWGDVYGHLPGRHVQLPHRAGRPDGHPGRLRRRRGSTASRTASSAARA